MLNKPFLRKEYLGIRKRIPDKEKKSDIITEKLLSLPVIGEAENIALYNDLRDEVKTRKLALMLVGKGKNVYFPRVKGTDMDFYRIKSPDDADEKSSLGVYEPPESSETKLDIKKLDVIIIPGVCFDTEMNRIGFGKGYYDGFLSKTKNVTKIAVCFDEQILSQGHIEAEKKDIKPDLIVTDKRIISKEA